MNAQQVVAYHVDMAKRFHRYIIPTLRRKEQESLRVNRRLRDEHLAMARAVKTTHASALRGDFGRSL